MKEGAKSANFITADMNQLNQTEMVISKAVEFLGELSFFGFHLFHGFLYYHQSYFTQLPCFSADNPHLVYRHKIMVKTPIFAYNTPPSFETTTVILVNLNPISTDNHVRF